jgi:hypothetical protein
MIGGAAAAHGLLTTLFSLKSIDSKERNPLISR